VHEPHPHAVADVEPLLTALEATPGLAEGQYLEQLVERAEPPGKTTIARASCANQTFLMKK